MKNLVFVFIIITLLISCSVQPPYEYENIEVYTHNIILPEQHDNLSSVDYNELSGELTLIFEGADFPAVGNDYYVIGYSDKGYLLKITDFSKSGDTLFITGTQDNLENIIKTGTVDSIIALDIDETRSMSKRINISSSNYSLTSDKSIVKKQDNFIVSYSNLLCSSDDDYISIDNLTLNYNRSMDFCCIYNEALSEFEFIININDSIEITDMYSSFDSISEIDEDIVLDTIYYEPVVFMFENIPVVFSPYSVLTLNALLCSSSDNAGYMSLSANIETDGYYSMDMTSISSDITGKGGTTLFIDSLYKIDYAACSADIGDVLKFNTYNINCGHMEISTALTNVVLKRYSSSMLYDTCSYINTLSNNTSFSSFSSNPIAVTDSLNAFNDTLKTITRSEYVSVILTWDSTCDLDLEVTDPNNERIDHINTVSQSGGLYVYDDKDGYGPEEIYWPNMNAPAGNYAIVVNHYEGTASANYTIDVNAYGETTQYTGSINSGETVFVADFTAGSKLPPAVNIVSRYKPLYIK